MPSRCFSFSLLLSLALAFTELLPVEASSSSSSSSSSSRAAAAAAPRGLEQSDYYSYEPAGWQSGPDPVGGSSFASGVVYNPDSNTVFVTGSTYGTYFDEMDEDEEEEDNDDFAATAAGCFLATYQLPSSSSSAEQQRKQLLPVSMRKFHTPAVSEACQSVVAADSGSRIFAAGSMERGGLLEPLLDHTSDKHHRRHNKKKKREVEEDDEDDDEAVQYGMVLDVTNDDNNKQRQRQQDLHLVGGYLLNGAAVVHPVSMDLDRTATGAVTAGGEDDDSSAAVLFIASMVSDGTTRNEQQQVVTRQNYGPAAAAALQQEQHDPAGTVRYGSNFALSIERLLVAQNDDDRNNNNHKKQEKPEEIQKTIQRDWRHVYAADDGVPVYPTRMKHVHEQLIVVVGSTTGSGKDDQGIDMFGIKKDDNGNDNDNENHNKNNDDMDGFLLRLDPHDGSLSKAPEHAQQHASLRIASVDGKDDWVTSVCDSSSGFGTQQQQTAVYVVGTTAGRMREHEPDPEPAAANDQQEEESHQAFVAKVNTEHLAIEWTVQLNVWDVTSRDDDVAGIVRGSECCVTAAGDAVYVAGTVQTADRNDRDVWLAQLDADTGMTRYAKTVVNSFTGAAKGQHGDDVLAGLAADRNGNAIIVANTAGVVYRNRVGSENDTGSYTDVVVFTVSKDEGRVAPAVVGEQGDATINDRSSPMSPPDDEELEVLTEQDEKHVHGSSAGGGVVDVVAGENSRRNMLVGLLAGLVAAVIVVAVCFHRRYYYYFAIEKDMVETDRSEVLKYLSNFHIEDIEMKHSATGGWHCCYANELAEGRNRGNPDTAACYANNSFKKRRHHAFGSRGGGGGSGSHSDKGDADIGVIVFETVDLFVDDDDENENCDDTTEQSWYHNDDTLDGDTGAGPQPPWIRSTGNDGHANTHSSISWQDRSGDRGRRDDTDRDNANARPTKDLLDDEDIV